MLVLFTLAWALVIAFIVRALVSVWRKDRTVATAAAFAVAAAFVVGALSPFSFWTHPNDAPAVVAAAPPPFAPAPVMQTITCPPAAKVAAGAAQGHIDGASLAGKSLAVAELTKAKPGQPIELSGWIVASGGALARGVCVVVDGRPFPAHEKYGLDRPDVGVALAKPEDRGAGVDVLFAAPRGSHTIAIGVVEADGKTVHVLDQPVQIVSQ